MVEGPVSNRRFSRRVVRQAIVGGAVAVLVLVVAIGGWYFYRANAESQAAADKEARDAAAKEVASQVAAPFVKARADLSLIARDPAVTTLFAAGDQPALDAEANKRQAAFPHALRLRFLVPGHYDVDPASNPPLTFLSLDLLRRAQDTGGSVGTEAHLVGKEGQHIAMVDTAKNTGGEVIGLLHLSLDMAMLEQAAAELKLAGGSVELRQSEGGKGTALASNGRVPGKGDPVIVSVPDTRWNVAFWSSGAPAASPDGAEGGGEFPVALIGIAVLVLLAGGAGAAFVLRKRAGGGQSGDEAEVIYAGAVKAIMEGAHPGMEQLVPNLPRMGQTRTITPVSKGMAGDDITMMVKRDAITSPKDTPKVAGPAAAEDATPVPKSKPAAPAPKPAAPKAAAPKPQAAAAKPAAAPAKEEAAEKSVEISPEIFRAYDIRGVVGKTLSPEIVEKIGQAIGSEAVKRGTRSIIVGRDGRKSGPELVEALIKGIRAAGRDVIDIGMVPTPLLYFATHEMGTGSGVMLTGSHNGPEYNGLKIMLTGETLAEEAIRGLHDRIKTGALETGAGSLKTAEVNAEYILKVAEDIPVALGNSFKLVVDCGNGVAGIIAPQLLRALGHDVIELYCEVDGGFPNHHPDPSQPKNLEALIEKVKSEQADLGLAFDGDGDRLGVVDGEGNIIWPDRQMMLLAADVLSRNPGAPIIFDVKCSRYLRLAIEAAGGKAVMSRTGHSLIKKKMKELEAPLAGEMSGHIFFKERWYGFDDAMYAAGRLLEVLVKAKRKPSEVFAEQPRGVSTPELRIDLPEVSHASFMQSLKENLSFDGAEVIDIDGFRVEFPDGWGLIRPSNTSPVLVLRFEADDEAALKRIQDAFRKLIESVHPDLPLPF